LKQAFNQLMGEGFPNFEIKWVGGKSPTLYTYDENNNQLEETGLSDMSKDNLVSLIESKGFSMKIPVLSVPEVTDDPTKHALIGGIHYEFFSSPIYYDQAVEFAGVRTFDGQTGRLLSIECQAQQDEIMKWLGESVTEKEGIWLGTQDENQEGTWTWTSTGVTFYTNTAIPGIFSNWRPGEPNNADMSENCAALTVGGWNDVKCKSSQSPNKIVLEFGPTHSSLCDAQDTPATGAAAPQFIEQPDL